MGELVNEQADLVFFKTFSIYFLLLTTTTWLLFDYLANCDLLFIKEKEDEENSFLVIDLYYDSFVFCDVQKVKKLEGHNRCSRLKHLIE